MVRPATYRNELSPADQLPLRAHPAPTSVAHIEMQCGVEDTPRAAARANSVHTHSEQCNSGTRSRPPPQRPRKHPAPPLWCKGCSARKTCAAIVTDGARVARTTSLSSSKQRGSGALRPAHDEGALLARRVKRIRPGVHLTTSTFLSLPAKAPSSAPFSSGNFSALETEGSDSCLHCGASIPRGATGRYC